MEDRKWSTVLRRVVDNPASVCVFLMAATLVVFWPLTGYDFINYDDPVFVTSNSHVRGGLTWDGIRWAFELGHGDYWHPLAWLSLMLDVTLFGLKPGGMHLVNVLLHAANSLLLFLFLQRSTGALWRSAMVAALFSLHPLHVESVAWITERKDVLSTLFGMLTLLAYGRYVEQSAGWGRKAKLWYGLALVMFALSLMTKAMLVTLPFVLLLLDYWPLRRLENRTQSAGLRSWFPLLVEKTPFLLLSVASSVITGLAQKEAWRSLGNLTLNDRIANALVSYCRYLGKMLWPAQLALPYPHPWHWPWMQAALAAALVAGLSIRALWAARRLPFVFVGWFLFCGTLIPVIGLFQVGNQSMADRFTYVPLIGIFIILVWGAVDVFMRWRVPRPMADLMAALTLVSCGLMTRQQVSYWHDSERLFRHTLAVTQDNYVALNNLGAYLFGRRRVDEAIECYKRALLIFPLYPEALFNMAAALEAKGSPEAVDWYRRTLQADPRHAGALFNMGNALASRGKYTEALSYFQAAVQGNPDDDEARNNMGNALAKLGRMDEAVAQYRLALQSKPDSAKTHRNLAATLAVGGRLEEAIPQYLQALRLEPTDAATHYGLGLALALQGKWDPAILHYTEALRLTPNNPEAEYNLGYALQVQGQFSQAATHLQTALRLRPEFPLAHYNLGCVLTRQGQRDDAAVHLKEALRLKPDFEQARRELQALGETSEPEK
jgi:protein O-mannosyl-transferase